ncbi:hypothetical protein BC833DRAFT_538082 [Globomyces pollinis-pini]|nr:hypothetical protein BC833DRAFT_538082 [Globomyces pollinis-pini]
MQPATDLLQEDWNHRDFLRSTSNQISELRSFMTHLDVQVRSKMGDLERKLQQLESQLNFIEGRVEYSKNNTLN